MSDKQLLQDAAKAAGIKLVFDPDGLPRDCTDMEPAMNIFSAKVWNPIDDDGDALRLAVKLRLKIEPYLLRESTLRVCVATEAQFTDTDYGFHEDCIADPYAATRRAIVRAAAEIGRSKT